MRYPPEHKEKTRQRIIEEAARVFRESGIDGIGIGPLMQRLGMTHGGFYNHFPDRDALVAAALTHAFGELRAMLFGEDGEPPRSLVEVLRLYLHPLHRKHPESGCPMAGVGSELPHQGPAVRQAVDHGMMDFLSLLEQSLPSSTCDARARSDQALFTSAAMVGALLLSRITSDAALGERLLRVTREALSKPQP